MSETNETPEGGECQEEIPEGNSSKDETDDHQPSTSFSSSENKSKRAKAKGYYFVFFFNVTLYNFYTIHYQYLTKSSQEMIKKLFHFFCRFTRQCNWRGSL